MNTIPRSARALLLALIAALLTLTACDGADAVNSAGDDLSVRPAAVQTPTGPCQPWVNNPHETEIDGNTGIRPCDFPIPADRPVQQPGMSATDFALLLLMFNYGLGHHDYYYGPGYYNHYIGPAWNRWPGSYYGYGHRPLTRVVDARTYNTTVINHVNNTYAADEKRAAANPQYSTYKTASGKTYTGNTVPKTAFKGSNVPVSGPAGDAPTKSKSTTSGKTSNNNTSTSGSSSKPSPSGSYSKPSTSGSSSGRSSSGGSHSSGGGHR